MSMNRLSKYKLYTNRVAKFFLMALILPLVVPQPIFIHNDYAALRAMSTRVANSPLGRGLTQGLLGLPKASESLLTSADSIALRRIGEPVMLSDTSSPLGHFNFNPQRDGLLKRGGLVQAGYVETNNFGGYGVWKDVHGRRFLARDANAEREVLVYFLSELFGLKEVNQAQLIISPHPFNESGLGLGVMERYYDGIAFTSSKPGVVGDDSLFFSQHPKLRDIFLEGIDIAAWMQELADPAQIVRLDLFRVFANCYNVTHPSNLMFRYVDKNRKKLDIRFVDYKFAFSFAGSNYIPLTIREEHLRKYADYYLRYCPGLLLNIADLTDEDIRVLVEWVYPEEVMAVGANIEDQEILLANIRESRDLIRRILAQQIATIRTQHEFTVAVDLGGTKIAAGLVSSTGEIVYRHPDIPTPVKEEGTQALVNALAGVVIDVALARGISANKIKAVSIGSPGLLSTEEEGKFVLVFNLALTGKNLKTLLEDRLAMQSDVEIAAPVFVTNDMDTAVLGEMVRGDGRARDSFTYFTISTGVNAARFSLLDGKPVLNNLEIGAKRFDNIYFEDMASGTALAKKARKALRADKKLKTVLKQKPGRGFGNIDAKRIGEAALAGDEFAIKLIKEEAGLIGGEIMRLAMEQESLGSEAQMDEHLFVLGGGLTNIGELLFNEIRVAVARSCEIAGQAELAQKIRALNLS